jgi:hypothetical protein
MFREESTLAHDIRHLRHKLWDVSNCSRNDILLFAHVLNLTPMTEPPDKYRQRQRSNMIALIAVVVLIVGSVVLMLSLRQGIRRETCFAASHRACAPISEQQQ